MRIRNEGGKEGEWNGGELKCHPFVALEVLVVVVVKGVVLLQLKHTHTHTHTTSSATANLSTLPLQ